MIRARALHLVARVALRTLPPQVARDVVVLLGHAVGPVATRSEAAALADALEGSGTCLSRALVVASRLPNAAVVIGVDPGAPAEPLLRAHAWVEVGGGPLRATDPHGREIARL